MCFLLRCRLCLCRTLSGRHLVFSSFLTTTTSSSSTTTGKLALPAKRCQKTPRSALFAAPSCVSKAHAANSRVPVNAFWWAFQHTWWQRPGVCVCACVFCKDLLCLAALPTLWRSYGHLPTDKCVGHHHHSWTSFLPLGIRLPWCPRRGGPWSPVCQLALWWRNDLTSVTTTDCH